MSEPPRKVRPSLGDAGRNLRHASNPWAAVRGWMSNTALKIRRRDNCCGNYGEPGC